MKNQNPVDSQTTILAASVLESINNHEGVRQQLLQQLLGMERLKFERVILNLLRKSGFTNVQLADRIDKRGRTLQGGIDVKAYSENDIATTFTIAMVKQYDYPVPRRFVDELQNVMKRVGASQGLLITTSRLGTMARRVAASDPSRPVTLIDGAVLVDLLISHQIGVKHEVVQRVAIDKEFLAGLH